MQVQTDWYVIDFMHMQCYQLSLQMKLDVLLLSYIMSLTSWTQTALCN